MMFVKVFSENF